MRKVYLPASAWKRLAAFIIDIILVNILFLGPFSKIMSDTPFTNLENLMVLLVMVSIIFFTYFVFSEYYLGATAGMHLMRLHMAGKYSFLTCIVRNAYFIPIFPLTLLWIIEPIHVLVKQHRLMEVLSKTYTVEEVRI